MSLLTLPTAATGDHRGHGTCPARAASVLRTTGPHQSKGALEAQGVRVDGHDRRRRVQLLSPAIVIDHGNRIDVEQRRLVIAARGPRQSADIEGIALEVVFIDRTR